MIHKKVKKILKQLHHHIFHFEPVFYFLVKKMKPTAFEVFLLVEILTGITFLLWAYFMQTKNSLTIFESQTVLLGDLIFIPLATVFSFKFFQYFFSDIEKTFNHKKAKIIFLSCVFFAILTGVFSQIPFLTNSAEISWFEDLDGVSLSYLGYYHLFVIISGFYLTFVTIAAEFILPHKGVRKYFHHLYKENEFFLIFLGFVFLYFFVNILLNLFGINLIGLT